METRLAEAQDTIGEHRQRYRESEQEVKRLERLEDVRVSHHTIVISPTSSARRNNPIEEEESPRPNDSTERTDTSCSLPMPEIYPILEERKNHALERKNQKRRTMGAQGQSFSGQRSNQPGQIRSRRCASKNLFDEMTMGKKRADRMNSRDDKLRESGRFEPQNTANLEEIKAFK